MNLVDLETVMNNFSGGVPSLENLHKLPWLLFSSDHLGSGQRCDLSFLCSLEKATGLKMLSMANTNNSFGGTMPDCLSNFSRALTEADLNGNNFEGSIPLNSSKCQILIELDLSDNNISNTISPEVIGLSLLSLLLNLPCNHLTGVLPFEEGNWKILAYLNVSSNMLCDEIPISPSNCEGFENVGLLLYGFIPKSISSLRGIEELDLLHNNLSVELSKFSKAFDFLRILDLSCNDHEGMVLIEGIFKNVSATFVIRNDKLCGGMPEFQLPKCSLGASQTIPSIKMLPKQFHKLKLIIFIFLGILVIALVLASLFLYQLKRKRKKLVFTSGLNVSYVTIVQVTDNYLQKT